MINLRPPLGPIAETATPAVPLVDETASPAFLAAFGGSGWTLDTPFGLRASHKRRAGNHASHLRRCRAATC
eukprot:15444238-Alexandrium_andersonii.AAC.1